MAKISIEILEEVDTEKIIPKLKEFGEIARKIKRYYPSTWEALVKQHRLDGWGDKIISDELFDRKLEILLMQDEELRQK